MKGEVTAQLEAVFRISTRGTRGHQIEVEAVIDTGFTGYLALPAATVSLLALPLQGTRQALLGDGQRVFLDIYRGEVTWNGQPREVQILEAEGGALAGMSLLHGHEVHLQVWDGGRVVIEPRS